MKLEAKHKFEERPVVSHNKINTGIGIITWGANNMDCQRLMEVLDEKIQEIGVKSMIESLSKI